MKKGTGPDRHHNRTLQDSISKQVVNSGRPRLELNFVKNRSWNEIKTTYPLWALLYVDILLLVCFWAVVLCFTYLSSKVWEEKVYRWRAGQVLARSWIASSHYCSNASGLALFSTFDEHTARLPLFYGPSAAALLWRCWGLRIAVLFGVYHYFCGVFLCPSLSLRYLSKTHFGTAYLWRRRWSGMDPVVTGPAITAMVLGRTELSAAEIKNSSAGH